MLIWYTGPMASGKTTALFNKAEEALNQGKRVVIFKGVYRSHNDAVKWAKLELPTVRVADAVAPDDVLLIDEAQFLEQDELNHILGLAATGTTVLCAGLDYDSAGRVWRNAVVLDNAANTIVQFRGRCSCGRPSTRTYLNRATGDWTSVCWDCWLRGSVRLENQKDLGFDAPDKSPE